MINDPTKIQIRTDPIQRRMSGYTAHGGFYFEAPFISHIEGNLWQGGCQDGMILPEFIENVVSLYPWEKYTVNHELNSFVEVTMYDSLDQSFDQVEGIAEWVKDCCELGPTLVHCQAGLNRSGLVAARVLMLQGKTGKEAIDILRSTRSPAVLCNYTFEKYILEQV
jgi:protein-tyrosine phosphatase